MLNVNDAITFFLRSAKETKRPQNRWRKVKRNRTRWEKKCQSGRRVLKIYPTIYHECNSIYAHRRTEKKTLNLTSRWAKKCVCDKWQARCYSTIKPNPENKNYKNEATRRKCKIASCKIRKECPWITIVMGLVHINFLCSVCFVCCLCPQLREQCMAWFWCNTTLRI